MIPFVSQQGLPVPVAAALFVEVWAYALMPLFAQSKAAAYAGFAVSFFVNVQFGFSMDSFTGRYCGFATGLMPFAFGAVVCHHRDSLRWVAWPAVSLLVWCAHGIYWLVDPYWPWTYGLWLSVPLSAWVVLSLADIRSGTMDKFAGELSYPLYLLHTTVAAWFLPYFGLGRGLMFFAASFTAALAASVVMLQVIDRPMQRLKIAAHFKPLSACHPSSRQTA
jgi:peptidoglycan/LPS O-acetylase OafA/YrhL